MLSKSISNENAAPAGAVKTSSFFQPAFYSSSENHASVHEASNNKMHTVTQAPVGTFFKPSVVQRKCAKCSQQEKLLRKESNDEETAVGSTENYLLSLSGGDALDNKSKTFFESRMDYDFSNVRIHTDYAARQSAKNINAQAYTHGSDIVFAEGQYQPGSENGKKLMAHELTHVIQQGSEKNAIQRRCGLKQIQGTEGCVGLGSDLAEYADSTEDTFKFKIGCDEFLPGEEDRLRGFLQHEIDPAYPVNVHGFASEEGTEKFNDALSCARAGAGWDVLIDEGFSVNMLYHHGEKTGVAEEYRCIALSNTMPIITEAPEPANDTDNVKDKPEPGALYPCCDIEIQIKYYTALARAWSLSQDLFKDKGDGRTVKPDWLNFETCFLVEGFTSKRAADLYDRYEDNGAARGPSVEVNIEDVMGMAAVLSREADRLKTLKSSCNPKQTSLCTVNALHPTRFPAELMPKRGSSNAAKDKQYKVPGSKAKE